jgi:ubiquinone/menaquinone biosynthesis C-methylase UbiE
MEGWIARWYTRTRQRDIDDFRRQAELVAAQLPVDGGRSADLLEVAPGPGFFSIELAKLNPAFHITALDVSRTFVQIATDNAIRAEVHIDVRQGSASAMPLADESFDFVYCCAAFKNFAEPVKALDEMHRVLRPGGVAMVQDLRKDVSLEEIDAYVKESGRRWFDAWLTRFTFRHMLIKRAYTREQFEDMARRSRFGGCQIDAGSIGFDVRLIKPTAAVAGAA